MSSSDSNLTMDEKTENTITRLIYLILLIGIVLVVIQNQEKRWLLFSISTLMAISITVRRAIIYDSFRYLYIGKINIIFDMILIIIINYFDQSFLSYIFFLVLIIDASLSYSSGFTAKITLLGYIIQGVERYFQLPDFNVFVLQMLADFVTFIGIYLLMTFIRYQIQQKEQLRQVMVQLKIKAKELEKAYQKLKETSMDLEDITVLRERNRISREIHDTVGHTLTTVLVELEAGERLIAIDPVSATTKVNLAKCQIRKGLKDIRNSVELINSGKEMLELTSAIKLLINETILHGNVHIHYRIDKLPQLTLDAEKAIYRALQEGITNGIRHGKSTTFVFNLKCTKKSIEFILQDNGIGTKKIIPGFGLTTMEERIKSLGGIFNIYAKPEEGCLIRISIPLEEDVNKRFIVAP